MFPECEKKNSIVIKIFDIIYMFPECEKKNSIVDQDL